MAFYLPPHLVLSLLTRAKNRNRPGPCPERFDDRYLPRQSGASGPHRLGWGTPVAFNGKGGLFCGCGRAGLIDGLEAGLRKQLTTDPRGNVLAHLAVYRGTAGALDGNADQA